MAHKSDLSTKGYIKSIAKWLISFITMIFKNPKKALKIPEHVFALGHAVLLLGLLIPSWNDIGLYY